MFKHLYIFIYAQIYEIKVLERRKCYETNLPTQEKTKKQSPRIPWKNVHQVRQKRSQKTSQQRQKETQRITIDMQKQYRLKKRASFAYVYRKGEKASARDLLLLSAKSKEGLKIGLSVSKKVGNAVTRNHVKRLLREAIKPIMDRIDDGYMYVIVAYPSIAEKDFFSVQKSVEQAFVRAEKLKW